MSKQPPNREFESFRVQVVQDDTYKNLPMDEYLDTLDIINCVKPGNREAAKLKLANAHARQIFKELREQSHKLREAAGLTESTDRIGPEEMSKMLIEIFAKLHNDMSRVAADTPPGGLISGIVQKRVANRLVDELRSLNAGKRTIADGVGPSFTGEERLQYLADNAFADQVNAIQLRLVAEELLALVKRDDLDEKELQVVEFIEYGIKTRQHFPIAEMARRLNRPVGTVRDVYTRVIEKLQQIAQQELD